MTVDVETGCANCGQVSSGLFCQPCWLEADPDDLHRALDRRHAQNLSSIRATFQTIRRDATRRWARPWWRKALGLAPRATS